MISKLISISGIFIRFTRPHTILHTTIAPLSIAALVCGGYFKLIEHDFKFFWSMFLIQIAGICANVWIVGVNQITDVEIDRVNKPDLPIAAGELTVSQAWMICMGILSVGVMVLLAANTSDYVFLLKFLFYISGFRIMVNTYYVRITVFTSTYSLEE